MTDKMLTADEVAEILQVSRESVYRLIKDHELIASKVGRAYQISEYALNNYLLSNSNRCEIQSVLFRPLMEIGKRNPDLDGDEFLEWLEEQDELEKQARERTATGDRRFQRLSGAFH